MYQVLFYFGLVLSILFFISTIVIFFSTHIISVCKYLFKMKSRKIQYIKPKKQSDIGTTLLSSRNQGSTEVFDTDKTELLDVYEERDNGDGTELLPNLNRK